MVAIFFSVAENLAVQAAATGDHRSHANRPPPPIIHSLYWSGVQGSGFRVQGLGFRVQGSGFRVQGSGCRVEVLGLRF